MIAVVGLGDMGELFVPHLLAAGHQVRGFDIDESRREAARRAGSIVATSGADAAQGAEVVLGLVMSDDIPAAYSTQDGILAGARLRRPDTQHDGTPRSPHRHRTCPHLTPPRPR